jgi:hypothetical protein
LIGTIPLRPDIKKHETTTGVHHRYPVLKRVVAGI